MGTEDEDAALKEIGEALNTSIGSNELLLTKQLGAAGYTEWKRRDDDLQEAAVRGAIFDSSFKAHQADLQRESARYVGAKSTFWTSMALAVLVATGCGVVEFFHWMIG